MFLQGNWCVLEGLAQETSLWVKGDVKEGSLLIASTSTAGCAQMADLAEVDTLQRVIAIAGQSKSTPGKGMISAFVSVALSAAPLIMRQSDTMPYLSNLIRSLQQQEQELKVCTANMT